ncbi:MAG: cell division protein FtsZ [Robiginitomaculum sp.]|nr:MAG: cell division protein FtsZ [Robiginitomaculum sp.]
MSINISIPKSPELKPRIVVIGVGGAGGNAVNNMINSGLDGVDFLVANTDAQAIALSKAERRIQMGGTITQGLGAGMRPEVGEEAAESSLPEIMEHLEGANMLFVAAGMGGGTGTGAAPVIAKAARERGILTVAIVTKPFQFEGSKRMALAEAGIETLYNCVDTLIVIPNQNLFRIATESTTMADAFAMADEVLNSGVRSITDLMVVPGLINLDFADVRTVMDEMGKAMMGTGEATGERRAIEAAESAIANPLLDDVSLKGAKGVLINITGGSDLTLYEVDEAASLIRGQVDPNANIIIGSALDKDLDGIVRISVVATGVDSSEVFTPIITETAVELENTGEVDEIPEEFGRNKQSIGNGAIPSDDILDVEATDIIGNSVSEDALSKDVWANENEDVIRPNELAHYKYKRPKLGISDTSQAMSDNDISEEIMSPVETPTVVKRPFGFFGRKKTKPVAPKNIPQTSSGGTGDLFGGDVDDELEIPSFLRRQNK